MNEHFTLFWINVLNIQHAVVLSQSKPTDNPQLKGDKLQPRPVSKRVFDAAEALLTAIIDSVVSYNLSCYLIVL
jgi:hypothetical protein